MIVYSSLLRLVDKDPRPAIRSALRTWLEQKLRKKLRDDHLVQGKHDLGRGHMLEVEEWEYRENPPLADRPPEHDWATAFRYSHPDRDVHGRSWATEIGVSAWAGKHSKATVRLTTEEQSALASVPIATTRPRIAQMILETCQIHGLTPGKTVQTLQQKDARAFLDVVRNTHRRHPVVVVSHPPAGRIALPTEHLADMLVGIADLAVIPADEDTRALQRLLDPGMCPYLGAASILWPPSRDGSRTRVARTTLLAENLEELRRQGKDVAAELMARVCHETNREIGSWHTDLASVRHFRQRLELDLARQQLASSASPEQRELLAMYEKLEKEDKLKIEDLSKQVAGLQGELTAAQADIDAAESNKKEAEHKATALELAVQQAKLSATKNHAVPATVCAALHRAIEDNPTLEDCLQVVEHLFAHRVVLLDTAWKSARAAKKFRDGKRALSLLWRLCTDYYEAMRKGGAGDKQAGEIFGKTAFAARESEKVENNTKAKALRTFTYKSENILMMRHLKIHVKESDATTCRIHFHWDAKDERIVIGHCGGHLDHD